MKKRVKRCSMCGKDNDIVAFECECGCSDLEIVTIEDEETEPLAHDFEKEDISEGICLSCNAIMPFMIGKCFICGGTIGKKTSETSKSESKELIEETPKRLALVDEKGSGAVFYLTDGLHVLGRAREWSSFLGKFNSCSREHLQLEVHNGVVKLIALKTTNGTGILQDNRVVAADRSPAPIPLEIGTVLVLGMQDYNDPDTAVVRLVQC